VEEHLGAAVANGLKGSDRDAELLALLDVRDCHVERALADADELGGHGRRRAVYGTGDIAGNPFAVAGHAREPARRVDRRERLDVSRRSFDHARTSVGKEDDHVSRIAVGD
jgi:hypothetical protein